MGREQFPHPLLEHCGVVSHMHQFGGQYLALLVQDFMPLAC